MAIEVKPKYLLMPLDEKEGRYLKVYKDGDKGIKGFAVIKEEDITDISGKLKDFAKPERVFLHDMNKYLLKPLCTDPNSFVELFKEIAKLQENKTPAKL